MVLGDVLDEGQIAFIVDLPIFGNHVLQQLFILFLLHLDSVVELNFIWMRVDHFKLQLLFSFSDGGV